MNAKELREKLAAIQAKLEKYSAADLTKFTQEDHDSVNALHTEFDEISAQLETAEKIETIQARFADNGSRKSAPSATANAEEKKANGFKNMGDFLIAVKNSASGVIDPRMRNTLMEKTGEEGGFLVPADFSSSILKKIQSDESLLSRTTQITVSGNSLSLMVDESAPWNGGVQAYWTAEAGKIKESQGKLEQVNFRLHKLAAMITVTDELLEDSVGLESYMKAKAPEAIIYQLNSAILAGSGVGKPKGILNSTFKYKVAPESGQTADTIVYRNIVNMWAHMIPSSRSKAVWFINPAAEAQLMLLKDDNGNFLYIAPGTVGNANPYGTLLGRPVFPVMLAGMSQLGDEGDIIFADLSAYYSIVKAGGVKESMSAHVYFDRDIQAFKWTFRVDGGCPFKAPIQTENGAYSMSSIITLDAR